jgi:chromosomal replication initiation ATPase DnaA
MITTHGIATPRDFIDALIEDGARKHGVSVAQVLGRSRCRRCVAARYAAIRRIHETFPAKSYAEIGRIFGRHHATIIHALKRTGGIRSRQRRVVGSDELAGERGRMPKAVGASCHEAIGA